ncbi:hypothetical protein TWF694_003266 [Orbilia ellipsospora]|uniref:FAD-binding domain-containing protein n=1 Tax=Orbilia ellipsospora TaxID=2528407 RepID=A0AAV9X1Z8_9PEZI
MPITTLSKSHKANTPTPITISSLPSNSKSTLGTPTFTNNTTMVNRWPTFRAITPLKVTIIGAGVGGLSTAIGLAASGHKVTIYEAVPEIKEVGAGIQIAPNASRILERFGVLEELKKDGVMITRNSMRRWEDDVEIGNVDLMPNVGKKYNAPLMVVHRADLQRILLSRALSLGVRIYTSSSVTAISPDFSVASIQLASGEWISSDLVIAADGVKSFVRAEIARRKGFRDTSLSTGDAAYRVVIDEERMRGDERVAGLIRGDVGSRWMGPGGHIMAYPVRGHKLYNMVLIHPIRPHQLDNESWTSKGSKAEMLKTYAGWNSTVRHLLSYVPDDGDVMEWTLNSHAPLPSWVEGRFVLIGDACHPMLPYVAQGAANAIEDAGVLTVALGLIDGVERVGDALKVYEAVRKERGEAIQASATATQRQLHLVDGKEQEERDRRIRESTEAARRDGGNNGEKRNPDLWADQQWQEFMWGVDIMKDTLERWDDILRR